MEEMKRPSKNEYYLDIAKAVSERSTCLRRRYGAVVVKDDVIVSTGYNGAPRGVVNCSEIGCLKDLVGAPHFSGYDYCIGVHAEENAIINAARYGAKVLGGILYLYGEDAKTNEVCEGLPCPRCRRVLINAGITNVITKRADGYIINFNVQTWIDEESKNYKQKVAEAKCNKQLTSCL